MDTNFPRITNEQELTYQQLKQLFPWGCSELRNNIHQPVLVDINPFWYRYQLTRTLSNIYKAIKYGVWTFPDPAAYLEQYMLFNSLSNSHNSKNMYYALCSRQECGRKFMYGVAQVVGFQHNKAFLYWTPESDVGRPQGIIRLKFVAVGKVPLAMQIQYKSVQQFRKYCKLLRQSRLDLQTMRECDAIEDKIRREYKESKYEREELKKFDQWVSSSVGEYCRQFRKRHDSQLEYSKNNDS